MKTIARTLGLLVIGAAVFGSAAPASAAVVNERSVSAGIFPNRIAVTPDGAQTWTLATTSNELIGYTTGANLDLIASWPLPGTDYGSANVAILSDGQRAIVTDASGDQVNIVDLATGAVTNPATLNVDNPKQLALSPDGSKVAIAWGAVVDPIVSVFNTSDWSFVADWGFFRSELTRLVFSPDSRYFAAAESDRVHVMDVSVAGNYVATIAADDTLYIGDWDTGAVRKHAADGSSTLSPTGLVEEMYGIGLTCGSVIVGDYQNTGYVVLDRQTLAQTGTIASDVYTYMMTTTRDATTTWVGGYSADYGLQSLTESECTLPDTGASPSVIGTSLSVSAGLLVVRRHCAPRRASSQPHTLIAQTKNRPRAVTRAALILES